MIKPMICGAGSILLFLAGCVGTTYHGEYDRDRFERYAKTRGVDEYIHEDRFAIFQCENSTVEIAEVLADVEESLRSRIYEDELLVSMATHHPGTVEITLAYLVDVNRMHGLYRIKTEFEEHEVVLLYYIEPWAGYFLGSTMGVNIVLAPCRSAVLDLYLWQAVGEE